ncbi:hypothetical protein, partial [Streptomyces anulatus]|uniref:hypothetical protein n=1 Tax=Streptomyces anulatus TaxID=1892 RepID=UPI003421905A
ELTRHPVEFPIRMGDVRGLVSLPELRAGAFGRPRLVTPPLIRDGKSIGWSDGRGPSTVWGTAFGDQLDGTGTVFVSMLAIRFSLPDTRPESVQQAANELFESVGPWSRRLEDWISVVLDRNPSEPTPMTWPFEERTHRTVDGLTLDYVDPTGRSSTLLASAQATLHRFEVVSQLGESAWSNILDHVNAGTDAPNERILLRDSRVELRQDHHRRAVLDAATATEISLTRMLDEKLGELPQAVGEIIRQSARQIGPLTSTLRTLGVELPTSLKKDLAEVRNKVIHAGYHPSVGETRRAVELAAETVELSRPMTRVLAERNDHESSAE